MGRKLYTVMLVAVLVVGVLALLAPGDALAGGKGGGKPKPPKCDCPPTVGECVLVSCGEFDCVYQCPFP